MIVCKSNSRLVYVCVCICVFVCSNVAFAMLIFMYTSHHNTHTNTTGLSMFIYIQYHRGGLDSAWVLLEKDLYIYTDPPMVLGLKYHIILRTHTNTTGLSMFIYIQYHRGGLDSAWVLSEKDLVYTSHFNARTHTQTLQGCRCSYTSSITVVDSTLHGCSRRRTWYTQIHPWS
jgi:hypothetical protein